MSEITTGAVALSAIGAPLAIGAACVNAAYLAGKYCSEKYQELLEEIDRTTTKLKWLNSEMTISPKQMKEEAMILKNMVGKSDAFIKMTEGIALQQKEILAGTIATQNSPLKSYVPKLLEEVPGSNQSFLEVLDKGVMQLALDNFKYVGSIVKDAAKAAGFSVETKILKENQKTLDIVFTDNQNRRFTAFCSFNKELNPSLALDLEGFDCDEKECSLKMDEIVRYLQSHGVPFKYTRLKHNQPFGVLRGILKKRGEKPKSEDINGYLNSNRQNTNGNKLNQH